LDKLTYDEFTSLRMKKVKTKDTYIERQVRKLLHKMGYRFRLRSEHLPGRPDIILPKFKTVIFVHGCFWHGHEECAKGKRRPKRNCIYWQNKIIGNIERDKRVKNELEQIGWRVLIIWECQIQDNEYLINIVNNNLIS
jgi:DNA mismatch endonuclease (patch repair protein)